jgi:hypothetical protein
MASLFLYDYAKFFKSSWFGIDLFAPFEGFVFILGI